ncbi:hypothetical protein [Tolypothrix sp. VBCCA 56010]|uniref:hypothetical protein n=1 Tax=Tolypothrix sp. VBCCA 56010 TaxID=3137731 RepID=UPI003D7E798D
MSRFGALNTLSRVRRTFNGADARVPAQIDRAVLPDRIAQVANAGWIGQEVDFSIIQRGVGATATTCDLVLAELPAGSIVHEGLAANTQVWENDAATGTLTIEVVVGFGDPFTPASISPLPSISVRGVAAYGAQSYQVAGKSSLELSKPLLVLLRFTTDGWLLNTLASGSVVAGLLVSRPLAAFALKRSALQALRNSTGGGGGGTVGVGPGGVVSGESVSAAETVLVGGAGEDELKGAIESLFRA